MASTVKRPAGVTFVVILTWLSALLDLVGGAMLVWLSFSTEPIDVDVTERQLQIYGGSLLGLALVTAAVALGLAAGSQLSRVVVYLLMLARIVVAGYALATLGDLTRWQAIGQIVGAALIILMLSTPRASAFFRGPRA
ncbi:hypothetical protein [Demequina lignilytica]|uniref:Uncharacterized protein n=1 Tax=Demequina lignilytica TaxID=3051663 RepID=A0AB35MJ35_9MICO|nr:MULTISPECIES: hypothetical protein [unclassified Demequina]MDN4483736.1 hypothetical protein [Demequina sp. SYSU T0a273]MDN4491135.1 hypothetical protein [Demequina sp. SYSU T00068]